MRRFTLNLLVKQELVVAYSMSTLVTRKFILKVASDGGGASFGFSADFVALFLVDFLVINKIY